MKKLLKRKNVIHILLRKGKTALRLIVSYIFYIIIKNPSQIIINSLKNYISFKERKKEILPLIIRLRQFCTNYPLIRLGEKHDGGYLVPDCLTGIEACFSPGVGTDTMNNFEYDCFRLGMKLFLADKSVTTQDIHLPKGTYHFIEKFVGHTSDENYISINDWLQSVPINRQSDLLLQMDIEGNEYDILSKIDHNILNRFRIIIIEFHFLDKLFRKLNFLDKAFLAFENLLKNHTTVHIHPNNYSYASTIKNTKIISVMEFTFLRNDYISHKYPAKKFPHPLDADNEPYKRPLSLPKIWYTQ